MTLVLIHNSSEIATPDAAGLRVERTQGAAVVIEDGHVLELGASEQLSSRYPDAELIDARRRLVTPGLVDCHTHLLFAGHRAGELQRRLAGESYAAIAAAGGGIRATVTATLAASDEALTRTLSERLAHWRQGGCTTVEVKSGYGLTPEAELRLLGLIDAAAGRGPVRVERTALLLHAFPSDWPGGRAAYLETMGALLEDVRRANLADAVDVYCDALAFSVDECRTFLTRAAGLGLRTRLHAEQLGRNGGALLAAQLHALAADHLECATADDWRALACAGTVGVLLPVAALTLGQSLPRAAMLRESQARVAIATDCNPGTAPARSLVECAALAARLVGLSADEALLAVTYNAALALGRSETLGHLTPGAAGDLVVWECEALEELTYWLPAVPAATVLVGGAGVGRGASVK
jgi:imidazolonepropionase